MKNIHVLPTDKPSRLFVSSRDGKIKLTGHTKDFVGIKQHIYITNSEEIKEGDWMYYKHFGEDIVTKYNTWGGQNTNVNEHKDYYKKIILTNDSTLIKDGIQAIDNEFLEWFVKNPSCEEVEIGEGVRYEDEWIDNEDGGEIFQHQYCSYKIIIPKEESKQTVQEYEQQGLEKYSYELEPKQDFYKIGKCSQNDYLLEEEFGLDNTTKYREILGFIEGAKWQQERMYNEIELFLNEVKDKIDSFEYSINQQSYLSEYITELFEQFKNK